MASENGGVTSAGGGAADRKRDGEESPAQPRGPSGLGLALCAAIAGSSALWSLFQWAQLVAARTGGDAYCRIRGDAGPGCDAMWDSSLATVIQTGSGLPIAGWGLVWSLVAFALPLLALARQRQAGGRGPTVSQSAPLAAATIVTAVAGLAVVLALFVVSIQSGLLCEPCAISYALVFSYAAIVLIETPPDVSGSLLRGVSLASGAIGLFYVLLFIPGLRTPEQKIERMGPPRLAPPSAAASARNAERVDKAVRDVVRQLRAKRRREFATALDLYRKSKVVPLDEPRWLRGAPNAPVRITQFTDLKCRHCATLHTMLKRILSGVPVRSFSIEPRYFPLDPVCNATHKEEDADQDQVDRLREENGIRCLAARAQICLEREPDASDLAANLYRRARLLDEAELYELTEPMISREELTACVASPETEQALQSDIAWAADYGVDVLPLVLLNGRRVPQLGPLLYSLILTGGDADHPAFDGLPDPVLPAEEDAVDSGEIEDAPMPEGAGDGDESSGGDGEPVAGEAGESSL